MSCTKLNPVGLGLSLGLIWGLSLFFIGVIAIGYSYGSPFIDAMGTMYLGYAPTIMGSIIGGVIGFIDAFISGFLIAWLYNFFSSCCSNKGCGCKCGCNYCGKEVKPSAEKKG